MKHECPDAETLAAYFDDLLGDDERDALFEQLIACPDCVELVATLADVARLDTLAARRAVEFPAGNTEALQRRLFGGASPIEAIAKIAVRWIGRSLQPLADALVPMPMIAGVTRGAAPEHEPIPLSYRIAVAHRAFEVTLDPIADGRLALVSRPQSATDDEIRVELECEGERRVAITLRDGGFTWPEVEPGVYRLRFESGGVEIDAFEIAIHAS